MLAGKRTVAEKSEVSGEIGSGLIAKCQQAFLRLEKAEDTSKVVFSNEGENITKRDINWYQFSG